MPILINISLLLLNIAFIGAFKLKLKYSKRVSK